MDDIGKVVHGVDYKSRGIRPPIRLEVFARDNKRNAAFDINLKVFMLQDIARMDEVLKPFIVHSG